MIENSPFIKALKKEPLEVPPIWYMRQAGRYMPEYRAVRSKFKNFLDMCKNPDVCCELAMQPIDKFRLDASILFSDILTIPDAFGLKVEFVEGEGPVFRNPIRKRSDIESLPEFNPDDLDYVYKAVSNIRSALPSHIPLIGFCGSPWTLAAYSIEGGSSKDFAFTRNFVAENADISEVFLEKLTNACFIYLKNQVISGANVLQIFDSWAGLLSPKDFQEFALPYINQIVDNVSGAPTIVFAKGAWYAIKDIVALGSDAIGVDWALTPQEARKLAGPNITLQGNFDPAWLFAPHDKIERLAKEMVDGFGKDKYIANLGHGILPTVPVENAKVFINAIKNYSA